MDHAGDIQFSLHNLFALPEDARTQHTLVSSDFKRTHVELSGQATLVLDSFPDAGGASCCFLRIPADLGRCVHLKAPSIKQIDSCPSGGWVLKSADAASPSYWIPQPPRARRLDSQQRILSEKPVSISAFSACCEQVSIKIEIPENTSLDFTIWQFPASVSEVCAELERLLVLETQALTLWNSQTAYRSPADVYRYLVHGSVYVDRFIWPRMWKICSELDAYGLYTIMSGLESATGKVLYKLLKHQLLFSVIARQAQDGGWYHGEWTDLMESHYRFHNGAMLILEAALNDHAEESVSKALERAAYFISLHTDHTDLGVWYLHDSLEEDPEMMRELCRQTGSTWIPARTLGKSPTNKLILNTHLDTIVTLRKYSQVSGDKQYNDQVNSALGAARSLLDLRPAEFLYRIIYRAIRLTLLPTPQAERLPLLLRAIKRLTWKYLTPQLHRLKRVFPRLVMPGGFIERHLSMPHYDINYHPVNVMDLARLWRCFPDEDLDEILSAAVEAVSDSSMLEFWAESKPRQFSLVVWVEALYHLYTLRQNAVYRKRLAEGIMALIDTKLGLPPSLLGADPEAVNANQRTPCPSPADEYIRVANLSCNGGIEILVVNGTEVDRELTWEGNTKPTLTWLSADGEPLPDGTAPLWVPSRTWLWGRQI